MATASFASNLKNIYRAGRDKSIQALVADIKEKYAKYLEIGRDAYNYTIVWTQEGYFMSPYHVGANAVNESGERDIYAGRVPIGEMSLFILEVTRSLESDGIYSSCSKCEYEKTPSVTDVYHMVISMRLSLNKPSVEWSNTGGY
jgi:hypothetical protein